MSIGEDYVGKLTPMRSNISRFSRGTVVETMFLCADIVNKQARHSGRNVLRLRFGPETERCLIGAMKENSTGLTKGEGALREQ